MSNKLFFVVMLVVAVALGCGSPSSEVASNPDAVSRDQTIDEIADIPLPVAETSQPDVVVAAFLDALRDGNDQVAEALLTSIARRETQAHELTVQPPGSPSARYEIGEVHYVQGGVHVNSSWSEYDESGEPANYEIVWVLRQEPIGWRVAGMATAVNPAKPPIYLNFEDVPDLLAKWQQADIELAAQAEEAQMLQAAQPATTLQR
ncbi:MAG: hypothetical protein H6821_14700 [Planctomycetaceae bacterium]|nr:hypothetical protein [Planctomycetales bacterium]MCB9875419.1 hypothetical protein [Planctomycetaceae bacterium]MCB9939342.1 hypothetical protein [Planctomycetaceae bacterium]HRX78036.1 hypothetical protein [Pirellulaceae bacterium]